MPTQRFANNDGAKLFGHAATRMEAPVVIRPIAPAAVAISFAPLGCQTLPGAFFMRLADHDEGLGAYRRVDGRVMERFAFAFSQSSETRFDDNA